MDQYKAICTVLEIDTSLSILDVQTRLRLGELRLKQMANEDATSVTVQ